MGIVEKYRGLVKQFGKFAVVGVANTLVDLVVLTVLINFAGPVGRAGIYYAIFKGFAFIVANLNSYVFNKFWTFRGEGGEKRTAVEFSEYFMVSVVGLLINVGVATFVATYLKIYAYHPAFAVLETPWPQIAALFGTAFGLVWNFLGYKLFVFKKKQIPISN